MKSLFIFVLFIIVAFAVLSCLPSAAVTTLPQSAAPDSIYITIHSTNISENMTGSDEIVILLYPYKDSTFLPEAIFRQRLKIEPKNPSRKFKSRLPPHLSRQSLLLFLLEQDSELALHAIDSAVRRNHSHISAEFSKRNYSGLEKYLADDDVLGIKHIQQPDFTSPNVFYFTGMYKLDKFEYMVRIEHLPSP